MKKFVKLAFKHQPRMIVAGASAYPRTIDFEALGKIANDVGALFFVDMAHIAGLVAAGLAPEPSAACTFRNNNDAQNASRSSRRYDSLPQALGAAIDKAVFPGSQGGPLMHIIAAKAVSFGEALQPDFKTYGTKRHQQCSSIGRRSDC